MAISPKAIPMAIRANEIVRVSFIEEMFKFASEVPSMISIAGMVNPAKIEVVELNHLGISMLPSKTIITSNTAQIMGCFINCLGSN